MDVRGFGKSAKSGDPAKYGSQLADDVIHLMDHLDIRRAHVAGQSMGALIAADVAARYPNRIATVTLISGPFYDAARQDSALVEDLVSGKGATRMFEPLLKVMDSTTVVAMGAQLVAQNDLPSLIASMRSFGTLRRAVAGSPPSVPALVICGTADDLLADSRRVATWWRGSRLIEVAGATHMVLARPEVGAAMVAFMKHE
jgi:pimeloyl-ACP methyl ester carboxylesterase